MGLLSGNFCLPQFTFFFFFFFKPQTEWIFLNVFFPYLLSRSCDFFLLYLSFGDDTSTVLCAQHSVGFHAGSVGNSDLGCHQHACPHLFSGWAYIEGICSSLKVTVIKSPTRLDMKIPHLKYTQELPRFWYLPVLVVLVNVSISSGTKLPESSCGQLMTKEPLGMLDPPGWQL